MNLTKLDFLIFFMSVSVIILTAAMVPDQTKAKEVRFYADENLVKTVVIGNNHRQEPVLLNISSREGMVRFMVAGDRVRAIDADCPNHICINSGEKNRPGEQIVCIPGRILAVVIGEQSSDLDTVIR